MKVYTKLVILLFSLLADIGYAQSDFQFFLSTSPTLKLPIVCDQIFLDNVITLDSTYLKLSDSLTNKYINQHNPKSQTHFLGHQEKFGKSTKHSRKIIGKFSIDTDYTCVVYLLYVEDSSDKEKSWKVDIYCYNLLGQLAATFNLAKYEQYDQLRLYFEGSINKDGDIYQDKKVFIRKDANESWTEDQSQPYFACNYFENGEFHPFQSEGAFYQQIHTPISKPKSNYFEKFEIFMANYPTLNLPFKFDSAFWLKAGHLKEIDSFGYKNLSFPVMEKYENKHINSFSVDEIGKSILSNKGYLFVYLIKYLDDDKDIIWTINYLIFNKYGFIEGYGSSEICSKDSILLPVEQNSMFSGYSESIQEGCINNDLTIECYNGQIVDKISSNGTIKREQIVK